jgi:hypothetical protein
MRKDYNPILFPNEPLQPTQLQRQGIEFFEVRDTNDVVAAQQALSHQSGLLAVTRFLQEVSVTTGSVVKIAAEHRFLPVLPRAGIVPVPLYEFVEVLDGLVDYDEVIEEFPGLTYSQVNGALQFLRRLSQFNMEQVDIDSQEQQATVSDNAFIEQLRAALADREKTRVLDAGELHL